MNLFLDSSESERCRIIAKLILMSKYFNCCELRIFEIVIKSSVVDLISDWNISVINAKRLSAKRSAYADTWNTILEL